MENSDTNTIPAVNKALEIIECLGKEHLGMSQAELCKTLDLTQSTCYRIMQTLHNHGWVCKTGKNRYDLDPAILIVTEKLRDISINYKHLQPVLELLSKQTGLASKISVRQGRRQVTVLRAESPKPMSVSGKVGAGFPLIEGSVGAVLLNEATEAEILEIANDCTDDIDEKNNAEIILERIAQLKRCGYCLNSRENRWRIEAMSVPVNNDSGQLQCAITLLGFEDDFSEESMEVMMTFLRAATESCKKML